MKRLSGAVLTLLVAVSAAVFPVSADGAAGTETTDAAAAVMQTTSVTPYRELPPTNAGVWLLMLIPFLLLIIVIVIAAVLIRKIKTKKSEK